MDGSNIKINMIILNGIEVVLLKREVDLGHLEEVKKKEKRIKMKGERK